MIKNNLYVLIVLPLLALLTVGCSGRRGPFIQLGVGMQPIVADEEWTVRRYNDGLSGVEHHDTIAATVFPAGNLKIGWGFTEQFLVSVSAQIGRLTTLGWGITVFQKKTAPSLFFDVVLGGSIYTSDNLPDVFSDAASDTGVSVGIGYEFKRNWTAKANFSFGRYSIDRNTLDLGDFFSGLFGGSTSYQTIEGERQPIPLRSQLTTSGTEVLSKSRFRPEAFNSLAGTMFEYSNTCCWYVGAQ